MTIDIKTPAVEIGASTTTASAALPAGTQKYIRVANGTGAMAYCNAGGSGVAATNANVGVPAGQVAIFERIPDTDTYVAVILIAGASAGKVSVSLSGTPTE